MISLFSTVLASDTSFQLASRDFANLQGLTLGSMITFAINAILILAALLFFFMLIIGGIRWIMSGGDKAGTEAARSQVTAALVGLVIVFSAWIILNFVLGIFGITLTTFDFGTIAAS